MSDLSLILIPLLFSTCFGLLGLALMRALRQGAEGYSNVYAEQTSREFEDLFLFIPAHRIADLARILAVTAFILFFFIFGDFREPRGYFTGFIFGAIGAVAALNLPRWVLKVLKARRLQKFNEQLTDALMTMSNALRAGFSIQQSFESVTKEGINPISQEFGLMLQQTRVGVRFEDAMENLESRVGSEDLTLMIRAIETARITGGNLTEVFEQIAQTIRERIRLEGKVRSLTAMGRLQAIVVGCIPMALLAAMMVIDPVMMKSFIQSTTGMVLIGLVILLEIAGGLMIQKMVAIEI